MPHSTAHSVADVVLSITLVASFISAFYFTYVARVEGEIVQLQMSRMVNNFVRPLRYMLPPHVLAEVQQSIAEMQPPDTSAADAKIAADNAALIKKVAGIFGGLVAVGVLITVAIWFFWERFNPWALIGPNVAMLVLVAATYFVFITFIARDYFLIDDNYVRYVVLENIQAFVNKQKDEPGTAADRSADDAIRSLLADRQ